LIESCSQQKPKTWKKKSQFPYYYLLLSATDKTLHASQESNLKLRMKHT